MFRGFVAAYRFVFSPILHSMQRTLTGSAGACRFQPTCSEYAMLALRRHGTAHGARLALGRVLRCHPFASGGFDPVPDAKTQATPAQTAGHLPRPFTIE